MFQLATVNKVIQMLIVGTFFLGGVLLLMAPHIVASAAAAATAWLLLPIAVFIGLVFDSIAELTTRPLFGPGIARREALAKALWLKDDRDAVIALQQVYRNLRPDDAWLGRVVETIMKSSSVKDPDWVDRTFTVALVFESKSKDVLEWAVLHQSLHLLASGLMIAVVFLLGGGLYALRDYGPVPLSIYGTGAIVALAALARFSAYHGLYTYEVVYRHAILALRERGPSATVS